MLLKRLSCIMILKNNVNIGQVSLQRNPMPFIPSDINFRLK